MPDPCRLIVDGPAPGTWNMAVDDCLLQWAGATGGCCWRFYQWNEPTLSLGYFQVHAQRRTHEASRDCPVVRRVTGGGAILHDRELTYSFVAAQGHRLALRRDELYAVIHQTLIETLTAWGLPTRLYGEEESGGAGTKPFLCFERRSAGDVVTGEVKIAGSAQRRRFGAILQHGSVLLARSPAAPELAGIAELAGRVIGSDELTSRWLPQLAGRLEISWQPGPLSDEEKEQAGQVVRQRHGNRGWIESRSV